jgi:manganese transport system substrate-binding protein
VTTTASAHLTRLRRLLAAATVLSLAVLGAGSCAASSAPAAEDGRPVALTTFTVLADVARNVGGEHVVVESITKPGAEIHGYEPTPGDIRRAAAADLVVDNGLDLEAWFAKFVEGLDVPHVVVSDGVEVMDITADAYAGKPNPHAWMSVANGVIYVENIRKALDRMGAFLSSRKAA